MKNSEKLISLCLPVIILIFIGGCLDQEPTPTPVPTQTPSPTPSSNTCFQESQQSQSQKPRIEVNVQNESTMPWNLIWTLMMNEKKSKIITIKNLSDTDLQSLRIVFETKNPNFYVEGTNPIKTETGCYIFPFPKTISKKVGDKIDDEFQSFIIGTGLEEYYTEAKFHITIKVVNENNVVLEVVKVVVTIQRA